MNELIKPLAKLLIMILLTPAMLFIEGLTLKYGWNNLLATIGNIPQITIIQAIAISSVFGYLFPSQALKREELTLLESVLTVLMKAMMYMIIFYILTLFV